MCTLKLGWYCSAIHITASFLYIYKKVCTLLLGNYVLGVPSLKLKHSKRRSTSLLFLGCFFLWRMFHKRGFNCVQMVKMWMTRESSDCVCVCVLLSVFCGRWYLASSALFFPFGRIIPHRGDPIFYCFQRVSASGVVKSLRWKRHIFFLAVALAANMASSVCIKHSTRWIPNRGSARRLKK